MYAIVVYDMEAHRTQKALKLGRRYLTHVQNSVLEGEISEGDLKQLRGEYEALLKPGESVIIDGAGAIPRRLQRGYAPSR